MGDLPDSEIREAALEFIAQYKGDSYIATSNGGYVKVYPAADKGLALKNMLLGFLQDSEKIPDGAMLRYQWREPATPDGVTPTVLAWWVDEG